jgi:hypothetical protein
MTEITCSREVTHMKQRSNKHAGITCNRKKHTVAAKKYLGGMFSYFMDDEKYFLSRYKHEKMFGFLDEKYTQGNMKNMHAKKANILVKHASY